MCMFVLGSKIRLHPIVDIYISVVSYNHSVAAGEMYIATVSTAIETSNPEKELQFGLELLEPIKQK